MTKTGKAPHIKRMRKDRFTRYASETAADVERYTHNSLQVISTELLEKKMYARVSTFQINTENFDEYKAQVQKYKPEIMALPGIEYWFSAANEDGSCASIAIYENEEAAKASASGAGAVFSQLGKFMETKPQPQGFQLIFHGVNP